MPDPMPSCFRGAAAAGGPPPSTSSGPTLTTTVYETSLGLAALSWSRTALGLLLRVDLRLSLSDDDGEDADDRPLNFKIRPWLFFSRRGSKRFHHRNHSIEFAWDLTRAKFPASGGPEPFAGFFLSIAVDGEIILLAGDLADLAFKKSKQRPRELGAALISRREHVPMREERRYETTAEFGGRQRSISIDLSGEMSVKVDGEQVLQIRRLRWKFRGSERVQLDGGDRIQLSWDLHNWLFPPKDGAAEENVPDRISPGNNAVFVFRFESDDPCQGHFGKKEEGYTGKDGVYRTLGGYFGKNKNWSDSSSGGGGAESGKKKKKKKKSLLKTSSSSSSSSASSAGSSTVMEWASPEENELRSRQGFSLLIYAWKS